MTIPLPGQRRKRNSHPLFVWLPEPTYQFNIQPASEAAVGYVRTRPCFWHGGGYPMRCCLKNHSPPLVMRLSLPLSLYHIHKGMPHKGNASLGINRKNTRSTDHPLLTKAFLLFLQSHSNIWNMQRFKKRPQVRCKIKMLAQRASLAGAAAGAALVAGVICTVL